jgi:hypothetical protein
MAQPPKPNEEPPGAIRRSFGARLLGALLLLGSVGMVSCQSLFFL